MACEFGDGPGGGDGQIDKTNSAKFLDVVPVGMQRLRPVTSFVLEYQSSHRSFQTRCMLSITSSIAIYDTEADAVQSIGHNGSDRIPPDATRFRTLGLGQSAIFEDYEVNVRIGDFFGDHVAVLGNTSSGTSCAV
ncbi:hypothetical protein [Bradyrhizobium viridifuturi]|uniref:hypothetical protein n=1 Tax=Bradyrhizobium viridifuturi TaxID=1654716 RepID=UPI000FE14A1D|nr:hypothetical protein [Bradyrhizobium viridifuturi]